MKKITLDQTNFAKFFTPVGPLHSHHKEHINPYNYIDRGSDTLLVTIGDSWTWGSGINDGYVDAVNSTAQQTKFRLDNLYGNIISKEKEMNWLNLGFYSAGNQWITNKVFELRALTPLLNFKKIIVLVMWASTGRWFNTWQDSMTDYRKFFRENKMTEVNDYENFFIELNRKLLRDIILLCSSDTRIKLLVGTNSVDHSGFDVLHEDQIILSPWYQLLSSTHLGGISVDFEGVKYLQSMEILLHNSDQRMAFQKWMQEKIDQAEIQNEMLSNMQHVAQDKSHPDHQGHKKWADYILKEVL